MFGGRREFSWLKIVENAWRPSCFLDRKSWKMHGGRQALFGSKKSENIK
jgi:hypothetical protein